MVKLKLIFLTTFILCFTALKSQNINTTIVEYAAKKSANNIYNQPKKSDKELKIIGLYLQNKKIEL